MSDEKLETCIPPWHVAKEGSLTECECGGQTITRPR